MKSKGIKNLLIDLGGVLINLDRQRCIENFQKLGLRNVEELLDISNQDGILMQIWIRRRLIGWWIRLLRMVLIISIRLPLIVWGVPSVPRVLP